MIGDTLSSRSADTLSLLRQNQTSPAKADTDSLQLVDLHAVQEVDSGFEGTPISYSPRTDDAIALTLLACFFLSSIALARGKKFLSQQVKDFVLHRERIVLRQPMCVISLCLCCRLVSCRVSHFSIIFMIHALL